MSLAKFFGLSSLSPAPHDDFWYSDPGAMTTARVPVNESNALNYSVCWAATRLLAGTSGWLPFNLYKKRDGGGADIDKKHHVHRLIHDQPNPDMGSMMFRGQGVNHQVNYGNTFNEIVRDRGGRPIELWPIHPSRIPIRSNIKRENGRLWYYVKNHDGGKDARIPAEDMFHVPSIISDDGIVGKGVVTNAREAIGKAMGTQAYGSGALANGGVPPFAIKGGRFKDDEAKREWRRQYQETHGGAHKAGKPLLLPQDAEVQVLGFSLEDAQFIESQQFDIEEISRWYGVPPHLVGHLLRATFNNIEELGISFVKYSLIQWLKLWEQEVWRKLLSPAEQQTHYAKFVVDALERGNLATRTEAGVKKFFNGLFTLNQWAEQEDMNPITETVEIDGERVNMGDMHFVQQAMIPLAMAAKGQAPGGEPVPPPEEEDTVVDEPEPSAEESMRAMFGEFTASLGKVTQDFGNSLIELRGDLRGALQAIDAEHAKRTSAIETTLLDVQGGVTELRQQQRASNVVQQQLATAMLRDVMSRMVSLEVNAVKRVAEKPSKFDERLQEFYGKHTATLARTLVDPVAVCLASTGDEREPAGVVSAIVESHVAESLRQLDALMDCKVDELSARVDECVSKWHDERATITL